MTSSHRGESTSRIRLVLLLAGFAATLGLGVAIGTHLTMKQVARLNLLRPTPMNTEAFPHALTLGWRLFWAPTPTYLTPEYVRKAEEADSQLGFDPGVIGPLGGIRKHDWQAEPDLPRAQEAVRRAFITKLGRRLAYVDDPTLHVHSTEDLADGIQRVALSVSAEPGFRIKACMLVPPGEGEVPAVILAYGAAGSFVETCGWGVEGYHRDMGLALAREGYVTVVYALRGLGLDADEWGEPEWEPLRYDDLVGYSLIRGSSAMSIWVNDGLQVLGALEHHPRVDADRIMMAGVSHGGQIAMFAGAVAPERVRGVLSMGSFASYEDLYTRMHHWTGHAIPGIGSFGDMGDIAALIAPRPLLIQYGEKGGASDRGHLALLRPSSLAEYERVKQVYERMGAGSNLEHVVTPDEGHHFDVGAASRFLAQHLM